MEEQPSKRVAISRWLVGTARAIDHPALRVILLLAIAVRVAVAALYFPSIFEVYDTPRFARAVPQAGLFDDYWMPAGYPAFLKIVHHLSTEIWVTVAVQHLIGIGLVVVVFAAVRRCTQSAIAASVAAAVAALSGDLIYLEHIILADGFLFTFSVLACACICFGLGDRTDTRWLVAAGVCAACAMLSRSVGLAVIVSTVGVALLFSSSSGRLLRIRDACAVAGGAGVILGLYVTAFWAVGGTYLGLADMREWNLYSRVAPFADCRKFDPPAGSRPLCADAPLEVRSGPFFYIWDENSVSRRNFAPLGPRTGTIPGEFAREVLIHQPLDYLEAVGSDLLRYLEPGFESSAELGGQTRAEISFERRDLMVEGLIQQALQPRYKGVELRIRAPELLSGYQQLFRVDRLLVLISLLATLAGIVLLRGRERVGVAVFGLSALGLFVLPTLTVSYDYRYGIPPTNLLAIAGTIAISGFVRAQLLAKRLGDRAAAALPPGHEVVRDAEKPKTVTKHD